VSSIPKNSKAIKISSNSQSLFTPYFLFSAGSFPLACQERRMENFFIWAHRGASARAPENTMAAFRAAEEDGVQGIELDLHLSRDGVPVVLHDEEVQRTTDGRGSVASLTLRQLRRLDAGRWFAPAFAGERIPTLSEVLSWAGDRLRLNLEIKSVEAAEAVQFVMADYPQCRVLISSFNHTVLEKIRATNSALPLAFLLESRFWRRSLARAAACRAESFHPRHDLLSQPLVSSCHQHGLKVVPWTVDRLDDLRRMRRLAVDGVFSNDPRQIDKWLRALIHPCDDPSGRL
jgi:glycerophosphoryl diester phosphodiesterase